MASKTVKELEQELEVCQKELKLSREKIDELMKKWEHDRKITVKQLRELANKIQQHEDNSRIAKLAGSSAGIVGGGLAIAGFVGAFFTFGATLGLTYAGIAISGAGGVTVAGADITNSVLRSGKLKEVEMALERDKDSIMKLYEELEKGKCICGKVGDINKAKW